MATRLKYDENSATKFRTLVQVFFYGHLLVFAFNFIGLTIISILMAITITLMFAYGIYINSNTDEFREGIFISLLFAISIIVENIAFLLPSSLSVVDPPETDQDFIGYFNLFANDLPPIIILLAIVTITGGIATIWFNKWFKNYIPEEIPQTNAFLIYGIVLIIANILTLIFYIVTVSRFNSGNGTIADVNFVFTLFTVSTIVIFAATIVKIIAIYKIYNRLTIFYNNFIYKEPVDTLIN